MAMKPDTREAILVSAWCLAVAALLVMPWIIGTLIEKGR